MKWTSPQCIAAFVALISGILLCYLDFYLSEAHEIHDNSLFVLGQLLIFSAGIFGVKGYVDGKFIKFKNDLTQKQDGNTIN